MVSYYIADARDVLAHVRLVESRSNIQGNFTRYHASAGSTGFHLHEQDEGRDRIAPNHEGGPHFIPIWCPKPQGGQDGQSLPNLLALRAASLGHQHFLIINAQEAERELHNDAIDPQESSKDSGGRVSNYLNKVAFL